MLRLNSWPVSPYSAKVRAYLRWKGAAFEDSAPSVFALRGRIQAAVGRAIMPTVELPDGAWLQDSSEIIDTLERTLDGPSITPPGARQQAVDLLLELHGDEWLPMAALHYRWNRPANAAFALAEFAKYGVPWLPGFLGRAIVKPVGRRMAGYLPILGVDARTREGVEAFTGQLLVRLDAHFAEHPFLLGTRPCLGDFALYGPLWAHLYRDVDTTALFDGAPHVRSWIERLRGPRFESGAFLPGDAIPTTLEPILTALLEEQGAYVRALIAAVDAWCDANPDALRVPRSLGVTPFSIGGAQGERRLLSEQLWMVQRPLDMMTPDTRTWLQTLGPMDWSPRHRVVRRDFKVVLDR
jgi:glutathione S-transferase